MYLFDEATSNLDPETEKAVMADVLTNLKGKTVIFCAHRLSSITEVDSIHVLKDGKLAE